MRQRPRFPVLPDSIADHSGREIRSQDLSVHAPLQFDVHQRVIGRKVLCILEGICPSAERAEHIVPDRVKSL